MSHNLPQNEPLNFKKTIDALTANCPKRTFSNRNELIPETHEQEDEELQGSQGTKIRFNHQMIFKIINAKDKTINEQLETIKQAQKVSQDFYLTSTQDESRLNTSFSSVKQSQTEKEQQDSQQLILLERNHSGQEEQEKNNYGHEVPDHEEDKQASEEQSKSFEHKESGSVLFIPFSKDEYEIQAERQLEEHLIKLYTPLQYHQIFPWMNEDIKSIEDSHIRLHQQIREFYRYIRPSKREKQLRMSILEDIKSVIVSLYPQAQVHAFGSFATNLYLPDGDIDIVALIDHQTLGKPQTMVMYGCIYQELKTNHRNTYAKINFIRTARTPIIKMYHKQTSFSIDISLNVCSGLQQIENLNIMNKKYPEFKYLIFVLKTMLKIRQLNETFSGGIGSFLLVCMLYHYLREHHRISNHVQDKRFSLGDYLLGFFSFYFMNVDFYVKTINVRTGVLKGRKRRPGTISMLSPMDETLDIGKKATRMQEVLEIFKNRSRLLKQKSFAPGESLLKQIVNPAMCEFQYFQLKQKYGRQEGQEDQEEEPYEEEKPVEHDHQRVQDNQFQNNNHVGREQYFRNRSYQRVNRSRYERGNNNNGRGREGNEENDDTNSLSY